MSDCIFCKIIKGEIPSYKIYEDELTYAFLDISNDCNGHTLVIPKKHCENILDCDEKYLAACMKTIKKIGNHFVQNCGFSGVNVLNASGKDAEQSVFHLHFHILPRKENDGTNAFPELTKNAETLAEVQEKLKIEEDKTVAGVNAEADYDANNISIQAVTGYEYVVNNYYVTPTIGLRYMNIDRDGYTDALGTNVDSNRMDILTAMLGVKFETDYTVNDWTFTPEVRAAVTYDLIHDDDNALVTLANGAAYSVDTDNLKRFGYELGAGVKTYVNDEWELGIGYEGKFRQDYQDHTGLISAKYHF